MGNSSQSSLKYRFSRSLRSLFRWANPDWDSQSPTLQPDEWRSQHLELSKTIWGLTSLLVGTCLFCLFVLSAPDANLISTDARITVPVAGINISYSDFLLFGPVFLVGVGLYLHVFLEQRHRLGRQKSGDPPVKTQLLSPYIFNLESASAELLSMFLFYAMLPFVLGFFILKSIPRPEDLWPLSFTFIVTCVLMLALKIRRFNAEAPNLSVAHSKTALAALWVMFAICSMVFFPVAWLAGRTFADRLRFPEQTVAPALSKTYFRFLAVRRLQLFGASLEKKNLSGFFAPYADLRKADLHETDLEGAYLYRTDLRKADLTDANLTRSNLRGAHLEGANLTSARLENANLREVTLDDTTKIDIKWRRVICLVNDMLTRECVGSDNLAWLDLSDADFEEGQLRGIELTGTNLTRSDLSKADLSGANLRLANLRGAELPKPFPKDAAIDGALLSEGLEAPGINVTLMNRESKTCLQEPSVHDDLRFPFLRDPCNSKKPSSHRWYLTRLANGYFRISGANSSCLDGSPSNEGNIPHMWKCGDDYETQYWRIKPARDLFVQIEHIDTGFCMDGSETGDKQIVPTLRRCNIDNHNQYWQIDFPGLPSPTPLRHDPFASRRNLDLQEVSKNYSLSPGGSGNENSSDYRSGRYRYRRNYRYRREVPQHRDVPTPAPESPKP